MSAFIEYMVYKKEFNWEYVEYECVFCNTTRTQNRSYWRKHEPLLKSFNTDKIVSKIKNKWENKRWREQQNKLISNSPTRDTEVIVFTENTQWLTEQFIDHQPHYHWPNITNPWSEYTNTQSTALISRTCRSFEKTIACLTLMTVLRVWLWAAEPEHREGKLMIPHTAVAFSHSISAAGRKKKSFWFSQNLFSNISLSTDWGKKVKILLFLQGKFNKS